MCFFFHHLLCFVWCDLCEPDRMDISSGCYFSHLSNDGIFLLSDFVWLMVSKIGLAQCVTRRFEFNWKRMVDIETRAWWNAYAIFFSYTLYLMCVFLYKFDFFFLFSIFLSFWWWHLNRKWNWPKCHGLRHASPHEIGSGESCIESMALWVLLFVQKRSRHC